MNELKPCPFCGKWAHPLHHKSRHKNDEHYLVMCAYCFGRTIGETLEEAIAAWNTRPDNWISVEDRLSVERGYPPVICGHDKDDWTDAANVNNSGRFINSEGCEIFPTHWQPLPAPPKGE